MQNIKKIFGFIKKDINALKNKIMKSGWTEIFILLFLIMFISKKNLIHILKKMNNN
jgi:hypothetical protein